MSITTIITKTKAKSSKKDVYKRQLENLKEWLKKKAEIFNNIAEAKEFGVPIPKGVMIAGVAGCGKSLSAKAAGKLFDMPLLRMDMGKLMGKYVGESEENMRKAIRCV